MQWPSLIIQRVIMHDVPVPAAGSTAALPLTLSECESPADAEVTTHIREKVLLGVRARNTLGAVVDPHTTSPVPGLVKTVFQSPASQFVASSRSMAQHLHSIQTAVNSPGLLAVADCSLSSGPAVAIMKLERDVGARICQEMINGQRTFGIQVFRDLLLTQATKLFKIGVFTRGKGGCIGRVYVFDGQVPYSETSKIARFYLRTFLGCKLSEDPEVTTERFMVASQQFFDTQVPNGTLHVEYTQHMLSELTDQIATISPRQFAERCLHVEHREPYLCYLEEHEVVVSQFPRDTRLIQSRLAKLQVEFEHGVKIIGMRDVLDQHVSWSDMEDGNTKAEVTGRLRAVRGA